VRFAILTASVLLLISGCRDQEQPSVRDAPVSTQAPEGSDNAAEILAALTDPEKLDSLKGKRAATPRLRKSCYWLEAARREGLEPAGLIEAAQRENGSHGTKRAELLKESLLRNLTILERLGCLDVAGIGKLRVLSKKGLGAPGTMDLSTFAYRQRNTATPIRNTDHHSHPRFPSIS
jgi:hypothetical protein